MKTAWSLPRITFPSTSSGTAEEKDFNRGTLPSSTQRPEESVRQKCIVVASALAPSYPSPTLTTASTDVSAVFVNDALASACDIAGRAAELLVDEVADADAAEDVADVGDGFVLDEPAAVGVELLASTDAEAVDESDASSEPHAVRLSVPRSATARAA